MNDFTSPDVYREVIVTSICRDCNKSFQSKVQYDKNGAPVSFRAKYCPECNMKPKITGNNGSWGTINIESAKIAQKSVEGLEERFVKTEEALHGTINLTFKNEKEIEELNDQNFNRFAEINHIEHIIIPKIKTLLIALHIMVIGLFVFDLGVVWYIIKH